MLDKKIALIYCFILLHCPRVMLSESQKLDSKSAVCLTSKKISVIAKRTRD